jgi:hypothetical protein
MDHMNPVRTFTLYFFKIRFNIILPATNRSSTEIIPNRLHLLNYIEIKLLREQVNFQLQYPILVWYMLHLQ